MRAHQVSPSRFPAEAVPVHLAVSPLEAFGLRAAAFQVALLGRFAIETVKLEDRRHAAGDFERQRDLELRISTAEALLRKRRLRVVEPVLVSKHVRQCADPVLTRIVHPVPFAVTVVAGRATFPGAAGETAADERVSAQKELVGDGGHFVVFVFVLTALVALRHREDEATDSKAGFQAIVVQVLLQARLRGLPRSTGDRLAGLPQRLDRGQEKKVEEERDERASAVIERSKQGFVPLAELPLLLALFSRQSPFRLYLGCETRSLENRRLDPFPFCGNVSASIAAVQGECGAVKLTSIRQAPTTAKLVYAADPAAHVEDVACFSADRISSL